MIIKRKKFIRLNSNFLKVLNVKTIYNSIIKDVIR